MIFTGSLKWDSLILDTSKKSMKQKKRDLAGLFPGECAIYWGSENKNEGLSSWIIGNPLTCYFQSTSICLSFWVPEKVVNAFPDIESSQDVFLTVEEVGQSFVDWLTYLLQFGTLFKAREGLPSSERNDYDSEKFDVICLCKFIVQ